jgi:hypothetical protein
MSASRFYFADAAVAEWYDDKELIDKAGDLRTDVNKVLRTVVEGYLLLRESQLKPQLPKKPRFR